MPTKKTNLGKLIHHFENTDEIFVSISKDADSFMDEIRDILYQFDPCNTYDMEVLALLIANFFANVTISIESEYPEFEEKVLRIYQSLKEDHRATLKKMEENGELEAYHEALQKRRVKRFFEQMKEK